ncbi:MAG: PLDc N-terminal domain-containing protein [Actinomycetota bacterium]
MTTVLRVAAEGADPLLPTAWETATTALGAVVVVLMVGAVASLSRAPGQDPVLRLLWLLVILAFPVVGSALWFGLGRRDARLRSSPPA